MNDSALRKFVSKSADRQKESRTAHQPFLLTREDVQAAFEFFDTQQCGYLNMGTLKANLSAFYPDLTSKEYHFLLDNVNSTKSMSNGSVSGSNNTNNGTLTLERLWEIIDTYQGMLTNTINDTAFPNRPPETLDSGKYKSSSANTAGGPKSLTAGDIESIAAIAAVAVSTESIEFDPLLEAFRVYDPYGTKYVDVKTLANIMSRIGFGELNEEELDILVKTADFDGDGKISFQDFRRLVEMRTGRMNKS